MMFSRKKLIVRVNASHVGNKQYAPNSFAHKFRPDVAEAPYQVSDNVVSPKSHYWHEGKRNEYELKELCARVISEEARQNTIKNTANLMKFVKLPEIQETYLAQMHVALNYAQGVSDGLPKKRFELSEVEKLSRDAHVWYKEVVRVLELDRNICSGKR